MDVRDLPILVVITGQFRSGTSAVAQVVNRLGVPVAHVMGCPQRASHFEADWEDPGTFATLSRWRPIDGREADLHGFAKGVRADLERRLVGARSLANWAGLPMPTAIASKCPLWALAMGALFEAASGVFSRVILIRTGREQGAIDASVDRVYPPAVRPHIHRTNLGIQRDIQGDALGHGWDLTVPYEALIKDPDEVTKQIAATIGSAWCREASELIRRRSP